MRNLLILLTALTVTAPVFAGVIQDGGKTLEERTMGRLEYLVIVLDLEDHQVTQVRTLQTDHMQRVKGIKDQYEPVMDELKGELEDIRNGQKDTETTFGFARDEARAVRDKYDEKLIPMREALKSEKEAFDNQLQDILNPEQQEKYTQLQNWKESNGPKMKHPYHKRGYMDHPGLHRGHQNGQGHIEGQGKGRHKGHEQKPGDPEDSGEGIE